MRWRALHGGRYPASSSDKQISAHFHSSFKGFPALQHRMGRALVLSLGKFERAGATVGSGRDKRRGGRAVPEHDLQMNVTVHHKNAI